MRPSVVRCATAGAVAAALSLAAAAEASAQQTLTPIFKAPYRTFQTYEFGASFSDPGEGVSFALEGFYRYARGPYDFAGRVGFIDAEEGGGTGIVFGADFRTRVVSYSETFPLDGAFTLGAGALFGEDVDDVFFIPIGVSLGRRFDLEGSRTTFTPFVHPILGPALGAEGEDDVLFALGLGVDIQFSESIGARVSGGIGDVEGVGISLAYTR